MIELSPTVSAILPCRNEARHIEAAVRSVLSQKPPDGGFEVLVVDGISDDGTRAILSRLAADDSRLRVVDNPRRITPSAMNIGIRQSRGRYIAIMGSHNRYAPDYLEKAVSFLERRPDIDNVGGAMYAEGSSYLQQAIAVAFHHPFGVGGARWHDPNYDGPADTVFGGVYRREVFDRIGLFDESLVRNQDDELNLRLVRSGGVIWHSPEIKSWYSPRGNLSQLFRQYRQYGYWKIPVIRKHRLPASIRHVIPALFVAGLLFGLVASVGFGFSALAFGVLHGLAGLSAAFFAMLLGCYLIVSTLASVHAAARSRWRYFPVLPLIFGCLHLGYGVGSLEGIRDHVLSSGTGPETNAELTR